MDAHSHSCNALRFTGRTHRCQRAHSFLWRRMAPLYVGTSCKPCFLARRCAFLVARKACRRLFLHFTFVGASQFIAHPNLRRWQNARMCTPILYHTAKGGKHFARLYLFVFMALVGFLCLPNHQDSRRNFALFLHNHASCAIF